MNRIAAIFLDDPALWIAVGVVVGLLGGIFIKCINKFGLRRVSLRNLCLVSVRESLKTSCFKDGGNECRHKDIPSNKRTEGKV